MSRYTLRIAGSPIEDAHSVLAATEGVSAHAPAGSAMTAVVDAPTLEQAEALVQSALPDHGSYSVVRPEPLEDDPDE